MLTIKIKTDNQAFQNGEVNWEIGRILHEIADKLTYGRNYDDEFNIHDINGNVCGTFKLTNR